jgi:hypothetical protein
MLVEEVQHTNFVFASHAPKLEFVATLSEECGNSNITIQTRFQIESVTIYRGEPHVVLAGINCGEEGFNIVYII